MVACMPTDRVLIVPLASAMGWSPCNGSGCGSNPLKMTIKIIKQKINKTNLIKKTYTEVSKQLQWNVIPWGLCGSERACNRC